MPTGLEPTARPGTEPPRLTGAIEARRARLVDAALVMVRTSGTVRALLVLLFASAAALSMPVAVNPLYAKDAFGASDLTVMVFSACVSLAGLLTVVVVGHRSDARSTRRPLIRFSFAWLATGFALMSIAGALWQMFAIGLVFYVAAGVLVAQLLAMVREFAPEGRAVAVTAWSRTVFSLGYIGGAPMGAFLALQVGIRDTLRVAAILLLACLVLATVGVGAPPAARPRASRLRRHERSRRYRLLLYFSATCILLSSGRILQLSMLPIVLRDEMHAPLYAIGVALAIPPLLELVLMPLSAAAAVRWGRGPVFLVASVAIVLYYAILSMADTAGVILLNQGLYALYGAAGIMLGIDIAQRILPGRVSTATSVYLGHEHAAAVVGSVIAVGAVGILGPQRCFVVPFVMCAAGLATVMRFRREWFV